MADPKRVLVVEDDESIRHVMDIILSAEGYEVMTAPDGQAALDAIMQAPPDLILLDMKMPRMNGMEFVKSYRQVHNSPAPIVVFTALEDPEQWVQDIQAAAFLPKPFELYHLLQVVHQYANCL